MILIMGPAGAGKTIQAQILVESLGLEWISTGHLLRDAMQEPEVKERMNRGELLDDRFVEDIVAKAIKNSDNPSRIILDGFPRNVDQSKWLFKFIQGIDLKIQCVLNIELPLEEAKKRLMDRGRTDDHDEAIAKRFNEYQHVTLPMLYYYAEHDLDVCTIDGVGTVEEVSDRIKQSLIEHTNVHKG